MNQKRPSTLTDTQLLGGSIFLFVFTLLIDLLDAPQWVLDSSRAAMMIGATYIIVASIIIARIYYQNFKIAPEKARLLPRHVVQLGVLVITLLASAVASTIDRVDGNVVWFGLPLLLPGVFVGVFGLRDMLAWLPHRREDLKPTGESDQKRRSTDA